MLDAAFSIAIGRVINQAVSWAAENHKTAARMQTVATRIWASFPTNVSFLALRIRALRRTDVDFLLKYC